MECCVDFVYTVIVTLINITVVTKVFCDLSFQNNLKFNFTSVECCVLKINWKKIVE